MLTPCTSCYQKWWTNFFFVPKGLQFSKSMQKLFSCSHFFRSTDFYFKFLGLEKNYNKYNLTNSFFCNKFVGFFCTCKKNQSIFIDQSFVYIMVCHSHSFSRTDHNNFIRTYFSMKKWYRSNRLII